MSRLARAGAPRGRGRPSGHHVEFSRLVIALLVLVVTLFSAQVVEAAEPVRGSAELGLPGTRRAIDAHDRRADECYRQGVREFQARRYEAAVERFLEADALLPSAALSFNIALAYDKLSNASLALRFYRDYL